MAVAKIMKGSPIYYELKSKYEYSLCTDSRLAQDYNVSTKTIQRLAKDGQWTKEAPNRDPNEIAFNRIQDSIVSPIVKAVFKQQKLKSERNAEQENNDEDKSPAQIKYDIRCQEELIRNITKDFCERTKVEEYVISTAILGIHHIRQLLTNNTVYYQNQPQFNGLQNAQYHHKLAETLNSYAGILGYGSQKGLSLNINNINAQQNINSKDDNTKNIDEKVLEIYNTIK
jgi:hypothetical protein